MGDTRSEPGAWAGIVTYGRDESIQPRGVKGMKEKVLETTVKRMKEVAGETTKKEEKGGEFC